MLPGEFYRALKKLNKNLQIYCGDDNSKAAGLWMWYEGEIRELCGVDKGNIKEWPTYSAQGKMLKGGWHRVIKMLVETKLVDRRKSYKYFGNWELHREPPQIFLQEPIDAAIEDLKPVAFKLIENPLTGKRETVPVYNNDEIVDIGRMIANQNKRPSPPPFTETGSI